MSKPSGISETEAARIVGVLRDVLVNEFEGNQTALAKALGVTQPAVSQVLSGKNKPDLNTARALGKITGRDYRAWLEPGGAVIDVTGEEVMDTRIAKQVEPPPSVRGLLNGNGAPPLPKESPLPPDQHAREQWDHLVDSAMETLIREDLAASEVRRAIDGVIRFKGSAVTLQSLVSFAREMIKLERRESGRMRKRKHV